MAEIPTQYTKFRCKAIWANTATTYLIEAKDEADAKQKCWSQLDRTTGGDSCLRVEVLGEV